MGCFVRSLSTKGTITSTGACTRLASATLPTTPTTYETARPPLPSQGSGEDEPANSGLPSSSSGDTNAFRINETGTYLSGGCPFFSWLLSSPDPDIYRLKLDLDFCDVPIFVPLLVEFDKSLQVIRNAIEAVAIIGDYLIVETVASSTSETGGAEVSGSNLRTVILSDKLHGAIYIAVFIPERLG